MLGRAAEFLPAVLMNKVTSPCSARHAWKLAPVSYCAKFSHRKPVTCDGSALLKDQPLHDDASWFRTLTNEDHLTRAGTLHYQALKGAQFSPADPGMPWDHELSGTLFGW
jgi:hypothetical protein